MARTCVIANPRAGMAVAQPAVLEQIRAEYGANLWLTRQPKEGTQMAYSAIEQGFERVVAAGGDGTISEVLNGIAPYFDRIQFGILPIGTANDTIRSFGIPHAIDAALQLLRDGPIRRIDLIKIEDRITRYCINVSAGGVNGLFNETVVHEAPASRTITYLRAALHALPQIRPFKAQITCDSGAPETVSLFEIVIANGRYVAHGLPLAPEAIVDDGMLDIIVFRETSLLRLAWLAPQVLLGRHPRSRAVIAKRVQSLRLESDPPMWLSLEGEVLGTTPVLYTVLPGVLHLVAPQGR